MFDDYEDVEDYEDELYRDESSNESSIESDIEFHLYSQVHYAQDLRKLSEEQECEGGGPFFKSGPSERKGDDDAVSDSGTILISDGADIITVSSTTDEESVYKCKGSNLDNFRARINEDGPKGHSTPVTTCKPSVSTCGIEEVHSAADISPSIKKHGTEQQGKNQNEPESVILTDSSEQEGSCDEDASQDDEESEDSDQIEEWMIIGSSKETADTSISLNLGGYRTSNSNRGKSDVEWSIGEKDREAQIINATGGRRAYRYYTADKKIRCRNCDKHGHLSKDCPTPKKSPVCCLCGEKDHFQNSCPERPCSNCSLPGHFYRECIERPYWKKHCHRCEMAGHYADACPETWRQYHITVTPGSPVRSRIQPTSKKKGYCYNCAQKGHYGHECVEKRMTPWILPTSPFIYSYDNEYSIAKREKRIYRKIQELCEAGLWELPLAAKRPRIENNCTTEPLTKKKKKKKKKRSRGMCKGLKEEKYKPDKKKNARQVNENQKRSQGQEFLSCEGMEDAFPRGSMIRHQVVNATPQQHSNSAVLFFHGREKQRELPAITKKRRRKRMGKKAIKHESSEATDNLFLIKQRKRKRNRSQKL